MTELEKEVQYWKSLYEEARLAIGLSIDQITITDREGIFRRVYNTSDEFYGLSEDDMVGKSCYELEQTGMFNVSVTAEVLKTKKQVTLIQSTRLNRVLLVTGYPVFNDKHEIEKIVNISSDITERDKLETKLKETELLLERYHQELKLRDLMQRNDIVAKGKEMEKINDLMYRVANLDVPICLTGETGVGKSHMARYIHRIGDRSEQPFTTINCAAIPEKLLESELFGYEKGAFTGALGKGKQGLFETVGKGTLFLDEISEMPMALQVKLLSVIEERVFRKLGSTHEVPLRARLIVASNKNLANIVKQNEFREDLYYRINVLPIHIPALRDRPDDLPNLIQNFLDFFNEKYAQTKTISAQAYAALLRYAYPGNIRELRNMMERLVITCDAIIDAEDVDGITREEGTGEKLRNDLEIQIQPLKKGVEEYEKKLLIEVAKKYRTTREQAKVLEVDQSTIVKKRKKYFGEEMR